MPSSPLHLRSTADPVRDPRAASPTERRRRAGILTSSEQSRRIGRSVLKSHLACRRIQRTDPEQDGEYDGRERERVRP